MTFEIWLKACETCKTKLFLVEGAGETALYSVKDEYRYKHQVFYTTPVYIGFVEGKDVCATTDFQSALACWRNESKRRKEKTNENK